MGSDKLVRAGVELLFANGISKRIDIPAPKWIHDRTSPDSVFVCLGARGSPGMKLGARFVYRENPDFPRKQCIGSAQNGVCIHRSNRLNVGNLPVRVDARVGSAGAGNADVVIEEFLKGLLKLALDRAQVRLNLPPVELRAVVGQSQLEVPHSIGYSMG